MFIFAKESKKGVKIFVPKKKFFEKKVTRGSLSGENIWLGYFQAY